MRKLFWFLVGFGLIALFAGHVNTAQAQACGYVQCEETKLSMPVADQQYMVCSEDPGGLGPPCHSNGGWIFLKRLGMPGNSDRCIAATPFCNCAAKPDWSDPSGPRSFYDSMDSAGDVKKCMGGCTFVPKGNYAADKWMATPNGGKFAAFVPDGWRPDGSQCDPFNDGAGPDPSGENCKQAGDAVVCIERKPDPPKPPKVCWQYQGVEICEDDPEACSGGAAYGFACTATPPNAAEPKPPEPPTGPSPGRPPDLTNPCIINGVPCEVRFWEPPFGDAPCPDGFERDEDGNCVPEVELPQTCPDGSEPVNHSCPAPYDDCADGTRPTGNPPMCTAPLADCPDGSRPIRGQCPAVNGSCPNGMPVVNGLCTAVYSGCSDGQPPVNGMCRPGYANCPNGSVPVAGQCGTGAACDPATDPNQCEGAGQDNAGGGGTCAAQPFCSGDIILCNVLNQQWQTRCAIEGLAGDGSTPTESDYGPSEDGSGVWAESEGGGTEDIDASGWLGGTGSCPSLGSFSFMDATIDLDSTFPCDALRILATLILAGAFVQAGFIVGRS